MNIPAYNSELPYAVNVQIIDFRILAGGGIAGDVFKYYLMRVEKAIEKCFYGELQIDAETRAKPGAVFPDGVGDCSQGDAGRPEEFASGR